MAVPIRIASNAFRDAEDLSELLSRHGLPSRSVRTGGSWTVEVASSGEETEMLLHDVRAVLEEWLDDRGRDAVLVQAGGRTVRVSLPERARGGGSAR